MIALKMLLTVAGVLLLAVAVAIPLYGLWLRIRYALKKKAGGDGLLLESGAAEPEPEPIAWRGPVALALVACLPLLIATQHRGGAERDGRRAHQPDRRHAAGDALSGVHFVTPLVDSVQMFDLRDHLFTAGIVDAGQSRAQKNATERAVARGAEHRPGGDGALPARPEQAGERAGAPAAAGGQGTGASGGGQRVAGTGAAVHGARDLLDQARRGAERRRRASSRSKLASGRHCGGRGDALRHSVAGGVCEGAGRPAAEGAGGRPDGRGHRYPAEAGEDCRAAGRGRGGAEGEGGRGRCAVEGGRGQGRGGRDAVHAAAEAEAD